MLLPTNGFVQVNFRLQNREHSIIITISGDWIRQQENGPGLKHQGKALRQEAGIE